MDQEMIVSKCLFLLHQLAIVNFIFHVERLPILRPCCIRPPKPLVGFGPTRQQCRVSVSGSALLSGWARTVIMIDVFELVPQNERQLILTGHEIEQALTDKNVAPSCRGDNTPNAIWNAD